MDGERDSAGGGGCEQRCGEDGDRGMADGRGDETQRGERGRAHIVLTISSADLVQSMIIQGFWGSLLLLAQKFTNNFLQLTHYSKKLAGAVLNFRTR